MFLLGHPGIPEVYALGRSNFHEYLAMQLLGGHIEPEEMVLTLGELAVLAGQMVGFDRLFIFLEWRNNRSDFPSPSL